MAAILATDMPNNVDVNAIMLQFGGVGNARQTAAMEQFLAVVSAAGVSAGQVAHAVASLGIELDIAAKILAAIGKSAEFISQVFQAAR